MIRMAGRRPVLILAALAALAAVGAGAGWWWSHASSPPGPPDVALVGADPAVASTVGAARGRVLREPKSASAWGMLGEVLLANEYPAEAAVCLARAEDLDPSDPRWSYLLAWDRLPRDRDGGIQALRRAIERGDKAGDADTTPRLLLAEAYMERDDREQVEALCNRVLEQEPDNPRAHCDLGMTAFTHNALEDCIAHLLRAAESPFSRQRACSQLAAAYQRQGDETAAAEYARRAQQLPPDQPWPDPIVADMRALAADRPSRLALAQQLEAQERFPEEAALLQRMMEESPDDRTGVALGVVLTKMGDYAEAEKALRAATVLVPGVTDAHYYLSVALYKEAEQLRQGGENEAAAGKVQAAADAARRATELKPDHALAHYFLGLALKQLGRRTEAIEALRAALRCRPEMGDVELALGEALADDGQHDEAVVHLQRACTLAAPDDPRPREALARLRGGQGPP